MPFYDLTGDLEKFRSRCALEVGGEKGRISDRDCDVVITVLGLRLQLLSDLLTPSFSHPDIRRSVMRTLLSYRTFDVAHYVGDWSCLREALTSPGYRRIYDGTPAAVRAFKQLVSTRIHYKWTLTTTALLLEEEEGFRKALQWVSFDSRMNLPDLDLSADCCRGYLEFEASYPTPRFSPETLNVARRVAQEWLGDFSWRLEPPHVKHGPGATIEVERSESCAYTKNKHFVIGEPLRFYLDERFGADNWQDYFFEPEVVHEELSYVCDLVCVPKTPVKNRTISKESTTLQWLQQDLSGLIVDHIAAHPEIPIYLSSQEKSRRLAMRGSRSGAFDTIDLSNASDSNSCTLLEEVLAETPLLYPLMATRSEFVNVTWNESGHKKTVTIPLNKFAPMGSATCFPTESLIFAIACETAIRVVSGNRGRRGDFLVYGDDIVIAHPYSAKLCEILAEWGFTVNTEKSFTDNGRNGACIFREACGIECLDGADVTPLRVSRRFQGCFPAFHQPPRDAKQLHDLGGDRSRNSSPGVSVGQCDLANRLFLYGYGNCRRQLCLWLRSRPWYTKIRRISRAKYAEDCDAIAQGYHLPHPISVPYFIVEDGTDTNYHVQRRYVPRADHGNAYQRAERRFMLVLSRPQTDPHDENTYFSWVISKVVNPSTYEANYVLDSHGMITTTGSRALKWAYGWLPE
jgi:hypothetical protein